MTISKFIYMFVSVILVFASATFNSSEAMIDWFSGTALATSIAGVGYWTICLYKEENGWGYHKTQITFIGATIGLMVLHFLYAAWTA